MVHEYKQIDETNNNIIEIVSSAAGLELLKRSGNKNIKVCFPLSLCIGKLDSATPFNRSVLLHYYKRNVSYDFTNDYNKLKELVNDCKKIRVWSSHLDSSDYCLLLLICHLFEVHPLLMICMKLLCSPHRFRGQTLCLYSLFHL